MDCPCGSGLGLEACCGPYLEGGAQPKTAEALMRSRYVAYTRANVDYIIETHDPDRRKGLDPNATRQWAEQADWQGLEVVTVAGGGEDDDEGEVEFVARYGIAGGVREHRERSTFKRRNGRWYFHDGEVAKASSVVRAAPKVGRNDPCPCGSGKKYKKCCGARG